MVNKWRVLSLSEIADQSGNGLVDGPFGSNLRASSYTDKGIPVIRGSNLTLGLGRFVDDNFVYVSEETAKRLSRSICRPHDIVFTKKGTLGQTGFIPLNEYKKYLISSNQMKLTVNTKIAEPLYVYYYVSSPASIAKVLRDSESTGVPKTNLTYLKTFPIMLPPLSEQKAIAYILGALDDKIELNRQMNETLEAMAQALFKSWFVDFEPVIDNALVAGHPIPDALQKRAAARAALGDERKPLPSAIQAEFPNSFIYDEELGWIPDGWEVKEAQEIARIAIGKTPPRKQTQWFSDDRDDNVVWVSIRDMGNSGMFIGDSKEYLIPAAIKRFNVKLVPKDSVILSFKLTLGRVSIAQTELATNEAIAHFTAAQCGLTKEYVYCYLLGFDYERLGSTSSIAKAVNSKIIKSMPFLVPSRSLLNFFEKTTKDWFEKIKKTINESKTLTNLRNTLLPKLLSGELRVPDVARELETVK